MVEIIEAEKIIGKPSAPAEKEDDAETAKAEPASPEDGKAVDEGTEKEADNSSPTKPDVEGDKAVAKDKSEPKANSTPLDTPGPDDALVNPGSDDGKSSVESPEQPSAEKTSEKPTPAKPDQEGKATVVSKNTQDKAAAAKPESEDPKTRLWILVLSVLTL